MTYNSSFQQRATQAAKAKEAALEKFRARPAMDEKVAAERGAARLRREAVKTQKALSKKAATATIAAEAAAAAAAAAPPSEAERKAARDARYAARKRRK
jgi:hypothetical protein